jgi:N-acetylglucosaminyldiphosphoundecaprenol N-acetyl-beta-D-mannosaminyltransferase
MLSTGPEGAPFEFDLMGLPLHPNTVETATETIVSWADDHPPRSVFFREVPSFVDALNSPALVEIHKRADLVLTDGMPLAVLVALSNPGMAIGRVPGADMMQAICQRTAGTNFSHYFFGGKPGVAGTVAEALAALYPGLKVAGTFSPPFRGIDANYELDDQAITEIEAIKRSGASFIWVGLSSPKQEYWISRAIEYLETGVFLAVGAAFDFHAGTIKRAPLWMRSVGLEWLYRLLAEPKRLWRRYLVNGPIFILKLIKHAFRRG